MVKCRQEEGTDTEGGESNGLQYVWRYAARLHIITDFAFCQIDMDPCWCTAVFDKRVGCIFVFDKKTKTDG